MRSNKTLGISGWRALGSVLLFLLIPTVFTIAALRLTKAKGPQWLMYNFENPYNYLFNSLLLVKGQAPNSIYHPGTTTQVFGAVILRLSSLKSNDDLINDAIHQPESEIRKLYCALLIVTILTLWFAPWITGLMLRSQVIGLLIQVPSLFYGTLFWYATLFGPDLTLVPVSIAAVCCCTLLVVPSDFRERFSVVVGVADDANNQDTARSISAPLLPALTGLVCALGIATKLTFFPLVLIALLCCRNKKNLATFASSFFVGLAIALLPIYSRLTQLVTWTVNLGIHSGHYDSGPVGLPPITDYLASLSIFVSQEPSLVIIPCVTVALIILFSLLPKREKPADTVVSSRTALALVLIQATSFLAIAKESGVHYLIPLALSTGLNLVLLFCAFQRGSPSVTKKILGSIVLAALLVIGFKGSIEWFPEVVTSVRTQKNELMHLYRHAKEVTQNDARADYFFSNSPEFALCYGNDFAGDAFSPLLSTMYPNALFFNVFNQRFQTFTGFIAPEVIRQKYDHLYFFGTVESLSKIEGFDPARFETIDHAGSCYLQKWTRE